MVAAGLAKSNGEARKLIKGGGVQLDGEKVTDEFAVIDAAQAAKGVIIKKGKKVYHKIVLV